MSETYVMLQPDQFINSNHKLSHRAAATSVASTLSSEACAQQPGQAAVLEPGQVEEGAQGGGWGGVHG